MALVEFYVTCNPPLLPHGVDLVVRRTLEEFSHGEVTELLYEPDIAWFKAITASEHQRRVTDFIQCLLLQIVEEDTDLLELYPAEPGQTASDNDASADVRIVGPHPRVLPLAQLQHRLDAPDGPDFSSHQFPVDMQHLKVKVFWRGLESMEGWDTASFFDLLKSQWKILGAPASLTELEELLQCQISRNLHDNMLYIGSNLGAAVVERAVKTLDNLLRLATYANRQCNHLILYEGSGPFRLVYKWLSHMGLVRTTYVLGERSTVADEYHRLRTAVTLRAERQEADGNWVQDKTRYPFKGGLKPGTAKIFAPFNGYSYQKKQADAVLSLFGKISEARKVPKPQPAILDKSTSGRDDTDAKGPLSLLSGPATSPNPQPLPACERGDASHHHEPKLLDIQDPAVASEAESTSELIRRPSPRSFVETWRHDVGRAGPEEIEEPWKESSLDEDLITFDEPDQEIDILSATLERTEVSSTDHGLKMSGSMDRFNVSDNLICLDDEPQSGPSQPWPSEMHQQDLLGLDALTEKQLQRLSALSSPQDGRVVSPEEQQTLLDTDNPPLAYFGLRHEEPRRFMKTMSQRASRDGAHRSTPGRPGSAAPRREASNDISPAPQSIPAKRKAPASLATSKIEPSSCSDVAADSSHESLNPRSHARERPWSREAKASVFQKAAAPVSPTRSPSGNSSWMEHLRLAEDRVKSLAAALPLTPGIVSMELRFGRIYLTDLRDYKVDLGSGPSWTEADMLEFLNADDVTQSRFRLSTVLSTCGPDADDLVRLCPPGEDEWRLFETQVWYEFSCTLEGHERFLVNVDANTLEYHCRGVEDKLSSLYLHCVHRSWDMQVCVLRCASLDNSATHMAIAHALVASLSIRAVGKGGVVVETTTDERLTATVGGIKIRHVARYCQKKKSGSILSVTMVKRLTPGERQEKRMKWTTAQTHSKGAPVIWYEAAVSSFRGQELFVENEGLNLGQETSWTCDQLEREGVLNDICRPAFGMIRQMDDIGLLNDNGLEIKGSNPFHDTLAEIKERGKKTVFW